MSYDPRTITFAADMLIKPANHPLKALQKIHEEAFSNDVCSYKNFAVIPGGAQLSNPIQKRGSISALTVLPDRIRVQEQATGTIAEDFEARLEQLSAIAMQHLGLPALVAQQFVVQSLINPRTRTDAREFLADNIFDFDEDELAPLEQRPQLLGIRLVLPAAPADPGVYNVRIESYSRDNRSLFLENVGAFNTPVKPEEVAQLAARFATTYEYLRDNVLNFIANFDM